MLSRAFSDPLRVFFLGCDNTVERLQWEGPTMVCCSFLWRVAEARQGSRLYCTLAAPFPITGSATLTHNNNTLDGLKIISTPQMQTEKLHGCVLAIIRLKMAQLEAYDLSFNTQLNFPHHAFNFCLSLLFGPYF